MIATYILGYCMFFLSIESLRADNWLETVSKRMDEEGIIWMREQLCQDKNLHAHTTKIPSAPKSQCIKNVVTTREQASLMVFMSLSVPEQIWLDLSKEINKAGGVFVLRGLPNNSFKNLATVLLKLKERGMEAPIQLHPQLFEEYSIDQVPTFVVRDGKKFDKISGAISLSSALEKINEKGDAGFQELGETEEKI